jgi:Mn2+/Fe2+ NRAMP family transporter
LLVTGLGFAPASGFAQAISLLLVVVFALVTGRIVKLATDSSLFTGIAVALTYFFVINTLVGVVIGAGS